MLMRLAIFVCIVFVVLSNSERIQRVGGRGLAYVGEVFAENVRDQACAQRIVDPTDYSNVFSSEVAARTFLGNHKQFIITPKQFMTARYPNWYKLVNHARLQQSKGSEYGFWLELTDKYLNTPLEIKVCKTEREFLQLVSSKEGPSAFGQFQPLKLVVCVRLYNLKVRGEDVFVLDTLEHEIRHSIQKFDLLKADRVIESDHFAVLSTSSQSPSERFNYLADPDEVGVRLAWIVNNYFQRTGRFISNKDEAKFVLGTYGIKVGGSVSDRKAQPVPVDVNGLKELFYGVRSPRAQHLLLDVLVQQMLGLA